MYPSYDAFDAYNFPPELYPPQHVPVPSINYSHFTQSQPQYISTTSYSSLTYPQPHYEFYGSPFFTDPQQKRFTDVSTNYFPYTVPQFNFTPSSSDVSPITPSATYGRSGLDRRSTADKEHREFPEPAIPRQVQPRSKRPKRELIRAEEGDLIRCRWGDCHEMVKATIDAISAHGKQHFRRDRCCRWKTPGRSSTCQFRGENVGKHIGSHLHQDGEPSPWVVQCECGYRFVVRGSGNGHKPGCRFKKELGWRGRQGVVKGGGQSRVSRNFDVAKFTL